MWLFMSYMQGTGKQTCLLIVLRITCFLAEASYLASFFLTFFRSLFSGPNLNFILFPHVKETLNSKLGSLVVVKGSHYHIIVPQCGSSLLVYILSRLSLGLVLSRNFSSVKIL